MSYRDGLPYDAHDYLPDDEVHSEALKSAEALQAEYEQACTDFRVQASGKLAACGALSEGQGWAVFDINDEEAGSVAVADGQVDALLHAFRQVGAREIEGHDIPAFRILTNELIVGVNGNLQCLAYDYMLGSFNDAQYMVNAINLSDPNEFKVCTAAFFRVDGLGRLHQATHFAEKYAGFPQVTNINEKGMPECMPFGHRHYLEDKICALSCARQVLGLLLDKQPRAIVQAHE